ncbi:MAG: RNase adapter RapZ [Candidatus Dormibacteria bacterium]
MAPHPAQPAPAEGALVVVTGMSGAGKSNAVRGLESLGYRCTDNLPPRLFDAYVAEIRVSPRRAAVVVDCRELSAETLPGFIRDVRALRRGALLLYLDASNAVLARRYSEARKPHPLDRGQGLEAAINAERHLLGELKEFADVIDTSAMRLDELVRRVQEATEAGSGFPVTVMSFGFKHGIPPEADWTLDVRFIENPFYEAELRPLTGLDRPIIDYVMASPLSRPFLDQAAAMLSPLLDAYREQGKPRLVVAVGCTGGRHRSVVLAEELGRRLREAGIDTSVRHRNLPAGG